MFEGLSLFPSETTSKNYLLSFYVIIKLSSMITWIRQILQTCVQTSFRFDEGSAWFLCQYGHCLLRIDNKYGDCFWASRLKHLWAVISFTDVSPNVEHILLLVSTNSFPNLNLQSKIGRKIFFVNEISFKDCISRKTDSELNSVRNGIWSNVMKLISSEPVSPQLYKKCNCSQNSTNVVYNKRVGLFSTIFIFTSVLLFSVAISKDVITNFYLNFKTFLQKHSLNFRINFLFMKIKLLYLSSVFN